MENKVYEIKIREVYYKQIASGEKTFDLQKNNDYKVGDLIKFREWNKEKGYTGHSLLRRISYIQRGNDKYGLKDGYCILGLKKQ